MYLIPLEILLAEPSTLPTNKINPILLETLPKEMQMSLAKAVMATNLNYISVILSAKLVLIYTIALIAIQQIIDY